MLKALGFLSDDGTPTQRYHDYRDGSKARKVLGDALKESYSDLFVIKSNPTKSDKALIKGKFKSTHNTSDRPAELMARTFFALLDLAEIRNESSAPDVEPVNEEDEPNDSLVETKTEGELPVQSKPIAATPNSPALHYNIQIHLPATKDVEVFNAIFKSLKEHLLD